LGNPSGQLDILSRAETWLPFAAFLAGAVIGLFDDYFTIRNKGKFSKGLPLKYRLIFVASFATFIG
jgi:UDP-N-acetylmuramyl pentapeptide phosphotransferase/UDP-N-acetylglucosamine-1-phosphate transferase